MDAISTLIKVAKMLFEISREVQESPRECEVIFNHAEMLVSIVGRCVAKGQQLSESMHITVSKITTTLQAVLDTMSTLRTKRWYYRLVHRRRIRSKLREAQDRLQNVGSLLQVANIIEAQTWQGKLGQFLDKFLDAESKSDQATKTKYNEILSLSDVDLMETLDVPDSELFEATMVLSEITQDPTLPEGIEKECCERGLDAIRRRTGQLQPQNDRYSITEADLIIHHDKPPLGRGGFATVYRGTYRHTRAVAVKVLSEHTPSYVLEEEVNVWKSLNHVNILEFIGVCATASPPYMVSALKANGNALEFLRKSPHASRPKILHAASLGLRYLHDLYVVHGDIKAVNILIDQDGTACLSDFGLSRVKYETTRRIPEKDQRRIGTMRWMAPEQLNGRLASRSSDIYSFAMTMYEIFTGRPPFPDVDDVAVRSMVCEGTRPRLEDLKREIRVLGLDGEMWTLVTDCWCQAPEDRCSASMLCDRLSHLAAPKVDPQPHQHAASLPPPRLAPRKSSGPSFLPTERSEFLNQPSPRPHLQPHAHTDPALLPHKDLPKLPPIIVPVQKHWKLLQPTAVPSQHVPARHQPGGPSYVLSTAGPPGTKAPPSTPTKSQIDIDQPHISMRRAQEATVPTVAATFHKGKTAMELPSPLDLEQVGNHAGPRQLSPGVSTTSSPSSELFNSFASSPAEDRALLGTRARNYPYIPVAQFRMSPSPDDSPSTPQAERLNEDISRYPDEYSPTSTLSRDPTCASNQNEDPFSPRTPSDEYTWSVPPEPSQNGSAKHFGDSEDLIDLSDDMTNAFQRLLPTQR